MKDKKIIFSTTAILGKEEILYVPLDHKGISNSIGFFKKKNGKYSDVDLENLAKTVCDSIPLFGIQFKTKKSINQLIRWLRFYRDNLYKKELL